MNSLSLTSPAAFLDRVRELPAPADEVTRIAASAGVGGYVETLTHTRTALPRCTSPSRCWFALSAA